MKKLVAIILAAVLMLALAVPAFAYHDLYLYDPQNPTVKGGVELKKYTQVDDRDEEFYYMYTYGNFKGYVKSGSKYEYLSKDKNSYIYSERLDGEWTVTSECSNTYDEWGNLTGREFYSYNTDGEKNIGDRYDYLEFDTDGNVTKSTLYYPDYNGGFYKSGEYEFEYKDGKKIYGKTVYFDSNGDAVYYLIDEYEYDANGNVLNYELYFYYIDSQYPFYENKQVFEYDENGNLIRESNYYNGVKNDTTEYSYDSKGRIIYYQVNYFDSEGEITSDKSHWEFSYEETDDGYIAYTAKVEFQSPEVKILYNKDIVTLDKYGNMVKDVMFSRNAADDGWEPFSTRTWEYGKYIETEEELIVIDGKSDESADEENPNTGAPVISMALVAAVMAGAVAFSRKK